MSWRDYISAVSVPMAIPCEFSVHEFDGGEALRVELTVRCHETGEMIKVKTQRPVQPLGEVTAEEAAWTIRDLVRIAIQHEIDEAITIDGGRPFYPHRPR